MVLARYWDKPYGKGELRPPEPWLCPDGHVPVWRGKLPFLRAVGGLGAAMKLLGQGLVVPSKAAHLAQIKQQVRQRERVNLGFTLSPYLCFDRNFGVRLQANSQGTANFLPVA